MRRFLEELAGRFRRDRSGVPDEAVQGFLGVLEEARRRDMPCSEVFARLDEYVEKEVHGEAAARLMPLLREHFDLCPDCCEEYEALLRAIAETADPLRNESQA